MKYTIDKPTTVVSGSLDDRLKLYEKKREQKIKHMEDGYSLIPKVQTIYPRFPLPNKEIDHYSLEFFNSRNLAYISYEVTRLLKGVHPQNRNIIVSDKNILSVMDSVFANEPRTSWDNRVRMVIAYIVSHIKTEFETLKNNEKLDIEVQKYTGEYGIRKVPEIKLNTKRATSFIFNPRY